MAVYNYFCEACQKPFEDVRPMAESDQESACPTCGVMCARVPSVPSSPVGGGTPKFYPGRW